MVEGVSLALFFLCAAGGPAAVLAAASDPPAGGGDADASATGREPVPSDEELEKSGAVIGDIAIRVKDIFDPEDPRENRKLYLLANRLHRKTRDSVIQQQLLFKTGDRFSRRALEESARNLRKNRYLYDAEIHPVRFADGRVDVEVVTRDVWTLNAGVGLGRTGGANTTRLLLQDTNFLGTGKAVTFERENNVDRTTSRFQYDDKALGGSHGVLSLAYANNSDGDERSLYLAEPFYSLDSRRAAGLSASEIDQVDTIYSLGHAVDHFRHRFELFSLSGGLSRGLVAGWARRWTAGFTYRKEQFDPAGGFAPPARLPDDRTLSYPWVAFELVQDSYVETKNQDQIQRTEDLHLGTYFQANLGYAAAAFGADRSAAVFGAGTSTGFKPARDQTVLLSAGVSGRWERGGADNLLLQTSARYYWRDFGEHLFFITLEGDVAHHLDAENQLLLGGDTGLRGYPLRYQDGDERLLVTLEQRFFTDYYPFRLVRVGGAVFFDAGRTWQGADGRAPNLGLLKDAGLGLRLSSSRSGLGNVVHIDLAFPLDGDPSIKKVQWLVKTKASF
jgi:Surface antigen variable number repeat